MTEYILSILFILDIGISIYVYKNSKAYKWHWLRYLVLGWLIYLIKFKIKKELLIIKLFCEITNLRNCYFRYSVSDDFKKYLLFQIHSINKAIKKIKEL